MRHAQPSTLCLRRTPYSRAAGRCGTVLTASADGDGSQPAGGVSSSNTHGGAQGSKRLAVFVSGGGSNMRAIHAATLDGRLPASVEVCCCRASPSPAVSFSEQCGQLTDTR